MVLNQRNNKVAFYFLSFVILFCANACNVNHDNIIEIDLEANTKNFNSLKLTQLSNDIEYVVLGKTDSVILERIHSIDISNNFIVVYDSHQCFLFDRSGSFLTQIGKEGKGPGEYLYPGQVRVLNNRVFIPDASNNSLIIFDTSNNFIQAIRSPGRFSNQALIGNYFLLTDSTFLVQIPNQTGKEKYRIALFNRKGKVLKWYPNTTFFTRKRSVAVSTDKAAQFYEFESEIRYKEQLNDTLWQIGGDELFPIYIIKRGKYGTPNHYRGIPLSEVGKKYRESIWIHKIFESKKYFFLITSFMNHYPFDFYRFTLKVGAGNSRIQNRIIGIFKKNNKQFYFVKPSNISDQIEPTGIENDIDGGINFMPNYLQGDSILVGWFDSYEIKHFIETRTFKNSAPKYPEKKKELEQLANSLDENDNPVLMLVKLKE